jgi:16S rRNA (uracil1498-N3)-methyltransferase
VPAGGRCWLAQPGAELPPLSDLAGEGALGPALFLVGPEGGFSPAEVERALGAGACSIGFPTPVLRTPTAVVLIAALGVVLGGLGLQGQPPD